MDFRKKIDNILKAKGFKLWRLAQESQLGSTLEKAYKDNREMKEETTEKFLQNSGIRPEWWGSGTGPILKNPIIHDFGADSEDVEINQVPESIYRDLVEANSEYRLVPKTILQEEYRIMLLSELQDQKALRDKALESKDNLIAVLQNRIAELNEQISKLEGLQLKSK